MSLTCNANTHYVFKNFTTSKTIDLEKQLIDGDYHPSSVHLTNHEILKSRQELQIVETKSNKIVFLQKFENFLGDIKVSKDEQFIWVWE